MDKVDYNYFSNLFSVYLRAIDHSSLKYLIFLR